MRNRTYNTDHKLLDSNVTIIHYDDQSSNGGCDEATITKASNSL
jgi:hypothetical protein